MIRRYLNLVSLTKSQIIIFVLLNICGLLFFLLPHNIFWNMLDLKFSYNEEVLLKSFNAIGDEGRRVYYFSALILDTVYPLLYVSLFLGAYVKLFKNNSYTYIFPIAAAIFDIMENIQISFHLSNFPSISVQNIFYTSTSTSLKWLAIGISTVILIYGIIKKQKSNN